jgi:glucose/arabinose dehydrogenase
MPRIERPPKTSPFSPTPPRRLRTSWLLRNLALAGLGLALVQGPEAYGQTEPKMLDRKLAVRTVVSGLATPTTMAFLGPDDFLVLEKNTGKVQRVTNGAIAGTVLDLPVNSASERGLLGMALHPDFSANGLVYLYWTESATGADSGVLSETRRLGNRVDRFVWNGTTLTLDTDLANVVENRILPGNLIALRALQEDAGQEPRGNHDGGVLRFGPDRKLYVFVGDLGRRGELQNLPCGPVADCPKGEGRAAATVPDDPFGGPAPDNAHLSGVILRLNDNGTTPTDNPFFVEGAARGGETGEVLQKVFSYGHRNSFGMAFDPKSKNLWLSENGDDSFSELNLVRPGLNGGWVQLAGPLRRLAEFKAIETGAAPDACSGQSLAGLQQVRWPPENIAESRREWVKRLTRLPGSYYGDPKFSWKYEVAPAAIGFQEGRGLGPKFNGDLFMGASTARLRGGYLFRFDLTRDRANVVPPHRRLRDKVADNRCKHDLTESEKLLIGENFGVVTDLRTGPNGSLYAVSLSNGAVYEIAKASQMKLKSGKSRK